MKTICLLLLMLVTISGRTASPEALVRQAITEGWAEDVLEGPVAEESRNKLNATGTLTLSVKRLFLFEQPDCARVQLDFTQDAALLPGATLPAPYHWAVSMNICLDGQPPRLLNRRAL